MACLLLKPAARVCSCLPACLPACLPSCLPACVPYLRRCFLPLPAFLLFLEPPLVVGLLGEYLAASPWRRAPCAGATRFAAGSSGDFFKLRIDFTYPDHDDGGREGDETAATEQK